MKKATCKKQTSSFPHENNRVAAEEIKIKHLVQQYGIEVFAIGDGTAGRETEQFIKKINLNLPVFLVNEDGALHYSASEIAREEFPNEDITVRGAVSIGKKIDGSAVVVGNDRTAPAAVAGHVRQHGAVAIEAADRASRAAHRRTHPARACRACRSREPACAIRRRPSSKAPAARSPPQGSQVQVKLAFDVGKQRAVAFALHHGATVRRIRGGNIPPAVPDASSNCGCRSRSSCRRPAVDSKPSRRGACSKKCGRPGLGKVVWWPCTEPEVRVIRFSAMSR